jgi:hypothetical protein
MSVNRFMLRVGTPVLALAIALSSASSFAQTAPPLAPKVNAEVSKHFALGNDYYQEGKYGSALAEYDQAYELSTDEKGKRNWKILYNRGQCLVMLGREPEAIDSFDRYLNEGGDQIDAARRTQVEADIKKLRDRLGSIILEGTMPNGSSVTLDGRAMGKTPLAGPMVAASGFHDLVIRPPGSGQPYVASVKVIAGQQIAHRVVMTASGPTMESTPPPTGPYVDTPPPPLPPPAVLPPRPGGGLAAPSIMFSALLGASFPTRDYLFGQPSTLGGFELGASWRASGFWELGLFGGYSAGSYTIDESVRNRSDASTGRVSGIDANADYSHGILGARVRMHLVRYKKLDGWLGIDGGGWVENWRFSGPTASFNYRAASPAFGIGFGSDLALSQRWALGFAARFLLASASNGARRDCTPNIDCVRGFLPGEGTDGYSQSTARGFFELGLRLVYLIPSAESAPAAPPAKPAGPTPVASAPGLLF